MTHGDWTPIGEMEWEAGYYWLRGAWFGLELVEVTCTRNSDGLMCWLVDENMLPAEYRSDTWVHGPIHAPEWVDWAEAAPAPAPDCRPASIATIAPGVEAAMLSLAAMPFT